MELFEEYKFFAESTESLSERRQNATQTYLTINTAVFAILAFIVKDTGFRGWGLVAVTLPLFLVGNLVCAIWYKIIKQYMFLSAWRYDQLRSMEKSPQMGDSSRFYSKEWDVFYDPKLSSKPFGFARMEKYLPLLFLLLYFFYFLSELIIAISLLS